MADYEISQLTVKSSPAATTDYLPILDTTDTSTPPAGAGGSDKRSTVQAVTQAGAGLTTLGDVTYGGASGVPTRLAGSTVATRKFLRQLGTGSVSAAPAWDVLTAGDLPAAAVQALIPSGLGGSTDMTNIAAAVTALGGGPGIVRLAPVPGTPWSIQCGGITLATGQYIDASGCKINATGAGDVFRFVDSSTYSARTFQGGGIIGFPDIDGTSTSGNSCAVHAGDIFQFRIEVQAQNFNAGTTSKGVWLDNQFFWTEQAYGRIFTQNCTAGVVFDVNSGLTATGAHVNATGSFMRCNLDLFVNQGGVTFDGAVIQNGAFIQDGRFGLYGNFGTSSSVLTSATLRINGTTPAGITTVTNSNITNSVLNIGCELDTSVGTNGPYTIYFGTGSNFIANCTGNIDFGAASTFRSSNSAGQLGTFSGIITGDANLVAVTSQPQLFQGITAYGTYAAGASLATGGTISSSTSYIQVAPAAASTGVILGAGSWDGQLLLVVNSSANLITFATSGTSRLASSTGANETIATKTAAMFAWSVNTTLWYRVRIA